MQSEQAIVFLQALIFDEPGDTSDGFRDLGLCCSEHALILSLALRANGVSCFIGKGSVFVRVAGQSEYITRHWFVIDDAKRVYDSSIRFGCLRGVFPGCKAHAVKSFYREHSDPIDSDPGEGIWYAGGDRLDPLAHLTVTSATPYGRWLTSQGIDHRQFWLQAAAWTADILTKRGEPPPSGVDKRGLVKEVMARIMTPNCPVRALDHASHRARR